MRPIIRGACPQDKNGANVVFADYPNARRDMIDRLGEYCSYCEMQLDASLAIEHVRPKKPATAAAVIVSRALDWDNFLLACTNCNSTKGDEDVELNDYFWPDRDNTYACLAYAEGGLVSVAMGIAGAHKAQALITLVGLDKTPNTSTASDRRWANRREAWDIAVRSKKRLASSNTVEMREQIIETAQAKGYWSTWMTVFKDDADMLGRLIDAHPGTNSGFF